MEKVSTLPQQWIADGVVSQLNQGDAPPSADDHFVVRRCFITNYYTTEENSQHEKRLLAIAEAKLDELIAIVHAHVAQLTGRNSKEGCDR